MHFSIKILQSKKSCAFLLGIYFIKIGQDFLGTQQCISLIHDIDLLNNISFSALNYKKKMFLS